MVLLLVGITIYTLSWELFNFSGNPTVMAITGDGKN
jgi:hypothetical protein